MGVNDVFGQDEDGKPSASGWSLLWEKEAFKASLESLKNQDLFTHLVLQWVWDGHNDGVWHQYADCDDYADAVMKLRELKADGKRGVIYRQQRGVVVEVVE